MIANSINSYKKGKKFLRLFTAFLAVSLQKDLFIQYGKSFFYIPGNDYVIVRFEVEVNDGVAVDASEVVMIFHIGIITPGFSVSLDIFDKPGLGEGQQGSVHSIQGNIGNDIFNFSMQGFSIGVVLGFQ